MLKTEGVLHFTIAVKNLDRSEKFYTETLGFEKVGRTDRIVFLRAGNDFFKSHLLGQPDHAQSRRRTPDTFGVSCHAADL